MSDRIGLQACSYDSLVRHVAQRIKDIRTERGLSMRGMAQEVGTHRSVITKSEHLEGVPQVTTIASICVTYGLSWEDLLGRPEDHAYDVKGAACSPA